MIVTYIVMFTSVLMLRLLRNNNVENWSHNHSFFVDIDDCALSPCDQICKNEVGNYSCECNAGYRLQGRSTCADIDECSETPSICGANAVCNNTVGSYECSCAVGFEDQSGSCVGMWIAVHMYSLSFKSGNFSILQ